MRLSATLPVPGVAAKGASVFEHALTWALEAEKLDLPRLSARCECFIAMHWEHLHKYALQLENLSSPARHRIMMGMFHALQSTPKAKITCQACRGKSRYVNGIYAPCPTCVGTGQINVAISYPSFEDFMSWRTTPGGAS